MISTSTKKDFPWGSLFFVLLLTTSVSNCQQATAGEQSIAKASVSNIVELPAVDTTPAPSRYHHIIGVGDMMLGTNYPSKSYLPANGGKDMLASVQDSLLTADVTFGNLEGTILDSGGTPKRCSNPAACYVFRSPESYGQHFLNAGFDLLSLANNHSGDFGLTGRNKTKAVLDELGIAYAGLAGTDETAIIERNGIKYGFCAFAPNSGTCDVRNLSKAKSIVASLVPKCDIIIVSFHGGAEGSKHQHVTRKTETYYGENRGNVFNFAHAVVDAGADIVFGHGPHVTRAMELYNNRLICYSLGNFCTYGRFNVRGVNGVAPIVSLRVDDEGQFVDGKILPIYQMKTHGPKFDPQKRAIQLLRDLTTSDFPDTDLVISEEGLLSKKMN
ncbi:MAG: CapA family protein [Bacteroidota bacterium]